MFHIVLIDKRTLDYIISVTKVGELSSDCSKLFNLFAFYVSHQHKIISNFPSLARLFNCSFNVLNRVNLLTSTKNFCNVILFGFVQFNVAWQESKQTTKRILKVKSCFDCSREICSSGTRQ